MKKLLALLLVGLVLAGCTAADKITPSALDRDTILPLSFLCDLAGAPMKLACDRRNDKTGHVIWAWEEDGGPGKKVPKITAAGRGKIAEQILQLAYENGIKVREDGALAEMLAKIELDSPIPSEAFIAVAEILSYVYRANGQADPFNAVLERIMEAAEQESEKDE